LKRVKPATKPSINQYTAAGSRAFLTPCGNPRWNSSNLFVNSSYRWNFL